MRVRETLLLTNCEAMFQKLFCIIIKSIILLNYVNSENLSKRNGLSKLPTNDLQTCADSFDIHKDKIIRTQDSLSLGGKYIMEAETFDRENCLGLCCETEECDVFIFEEKKPGSCYLFHCGPPQNFKCKFTNHANYSSAVLTNLHYHDLVDHQNYIRRSQQEYELISLRGMTVNEASRKYAHTEMSVEKGTAKVTQLTTLNSMKTSCSRNQYECQASGDCIAIYNVCDGIPQCSDGSDEAIELNCPTEKPTPLSLQEVSHNVIVSAPGLFKYPLDTQRKIHPSTYESTLERPEDTQKTWQVLNHPALGSKQNELPRIFNHKPSANSVNMAENTERRSYIDIKSPFDSYYSPQNNAPWLQNQPEQIQLPYKLDIHGTVLPALSRNEENLAVPQKLKPPKQTLPVKFDSSKKKELETSKILHPLQQISNSTVDDRKQGRKQVLPFTKVTEKKNEKNDLDYRSNTIQINHSSAEHMHRKIQDQIQPNLKPKGAVISLALGLTVTAITAGLIACRLRVVRKRGRKGHGPYAHEADYLVNGMYL